jgi:hypothetical protein
MSFDSQDPKNTITPKVSSSNLPGLERQVVGKKVACNKSRPSLSSAALAHLLRLPTTQFLFHSGMGKERGQDGGARDIIPDRRRGKRQIEPCPSRRCSWPMDGSEGESGIGLLMSLLGFVDGRGRIVE